MQHLSWHVKLTVALTFVLVSCSISVLAQTQTTGAIEGRVREEAAVVQSVPGATVKVRNEDNGLEVIKLTDAQGRYRVDMLPPGTYTVSATHPGYEQISASSVSGVLVYLSQNNVVQPPPIMLRRRGATPAPPTPPSAPSTAAPAPSDSPELLVNITNAARGGNFDQRQLTMLPLPEIRHFESLAFLLPGVAPPPKPVGSTVGPGLGAGIGTAGQFSVNGQRARSNNFTVDGSDNNDEDIGVRRQGFVSLAPQSIESVQEFQVFTHLWEAWVGRNLGSQVNAVSQSGANLIHGAVYGFINHHALNARNFFDYTSDKAKSYPLEARSFSRITGLPDRTDVATLVDGVTGAQTPIVLPNPSEGQDPYRRLQGGITIGGPVSKKYFGPLGPNGPNQTFFFGSFERQSIRARQETHFSVPTVAQRGFLDSGASGFRIPGLSVIRVFDTSTGVVRLVDTLPIIRPTFTAGDAVFSLFPFPNNPIGPYGANTFTQVLSANGDGTVFSFKLDHNFRLFGRDKTDVFTARYNFTNDQRQVPAVGGAVFSGVEPRAGTQNLSLFFTSRVTARLTNQVRGSYGRTRLRFDPLRDPSLQPSNLNDASNAPFLLNQQRLLNISCSDFPGLPTNQGRGACLTAPNVPRNRYGFFSYGVGFADVEPNLGSIGQVIVTPFSPVGLDPYLFPQGRVNNTYQIADMLSVFSGSHNLQLGADIRRTQLNSFLDRNFRPQVIFGGTVDISGDTTLPANSRLPAEAQRLSRYGETPGFFSGSDLAALGISTGIFQALSLQTPNSAIGLRLWQYNFFFNDTWRTRPGLTLNYGLRFEYNTVPREVNDRIERTFDFNSILPPIDATVNFGNNDLRKSAIDATLSDLNKILAGRQQIYDPDRNNFGPHIGFAWDPLAGSQTQSGKTVVRGGAGIYYDVALGSVVSQSRNVFPTFLPLNSDTSFYSLNLFQGFPNGYSLIPNATLVGTNIGNNGGSDEAFTRAGCRFVGRQGTQNVYGCDFIRQGTLNVLGVPPGAQQLFLARILNPAGIGRAPSGAGLAFTLPDRQLRSPQSFHFNLQVERELFESYLINVAYVGTRGLRLTRFRTPNGGLNSPTSPLDPLQLSQAQGGAVLQPAISRPPLSTATRLSRPIATLGAFTIYDSSAASSYHSFQASVTKRFSRGWQLTSAYTWSHAIDDVSDVFDLAGAFSLPQNDSNLRAERGNANFDLRHRFVLSSISNVPFISRFNNAKGMKGALFGGWQVASISTLQGGQPFTLNTSYDINGDGNLTDRPNTTNGVTVVDGRQQKLALAVRPTDLLAAIGQDGKIGRNTIQAEWVINTDFTIIKDFRVREGQTLVFRIEAFNLWNRPQFGIPVRILEAPSFGRSVDTVLPARQIQLALKYVF